MKFKNPSEQFIRKRDSLSDLFKTIKASLFLLFLFAFQVTATSISAQGAIVELKSNPITIRHLIDAIEQQTDYLVIYSTHEVNTSRSVSLEKRSDQVSSILLAAFADTDIDFDFENNYIVLAKKEKSLVVTADTKESFRQQKIIRGRVVDKDNLPLPGVSIIVKGTTIGTSTDLNGEFTLAVPDDAKILQFSFLGMHTQEAAIDERAQYNISLEEETIGVDEVIVIGYGGVKKKDATGAVTLLKPSELNIAKATTVSDLLIGKIAGLQIIQGSGDPGSLGTIRIRQGASLNASNEPLIVIDGLTEGNLLSLNPNDIESINILKDASASAIYGARGANGVIIVTTKKGPRATDGKIVRPRFNYKSDMFINTPYQSLDVYSPDEFRAEYAKRGWETSLLGSSHTDWQREIMRTSISHVHNLSASGTLPYTPYRISVGYNQEQAIIINNKRDHTTATIALSPKLLNDHVSIDATFKYSHIHAPEKGGSISSAALTNPTQPIYYDYGPVTVNGVHYDQKAFGYYMFGADEHGNSPQREYNPLASAMLPGLGFNKQDRLLTNLLINYKVHGFEELAFNFAVNSSSTKLQTRSHQRDNTPDTWSNTNVNLLKGGIGSNSESSNSRNRYILDYYVNYNKSVSRHDIDLTLGHTYEKQRYSSWDGAIYYNDGDVVAGSVDLDLSGEVAMSSWFSRLHYKFSDRYLLTATLRADASSRFAPETRWGFFPSAAFAWKVNEERFLKEVEAINELKLRVSYGVTGQQNIYNDYAYQAIYYASTEEFMYRVGDTFYTTYYPSAFDRQLKWEVTRTLNAGFDFGLFNNRLYGALDLYTRLTSDMLMYAVMIPAGSNFSETMDQNIGEMSSRGVEITLGSRIIKTKDLTWDLNVSFANNNSRIEKLTAYDERLEETWVKVGNIGSNRYVQYHKVGETPYSFYLAKQVYDADGKPVEKFYDPQTPGQENYVFDDAANASKWDTHKSSLVPYYGGITTQLRYKSWDFAANAHYAFGHYVYWQTMQSGSNSSFFSGTGQYPRNTLRGWAPEWEKQHYFSDYWLFKGNYLKIDNIVAGYSFNRLFNDMSSLRIALGVQNLFSFTKYPGIDPEIYDGLDNTNTPKSRMYMLSIDLNF